MKIYKTLLTRDTVAYPMGQQDGLSDQCNPYPEISGLRFATIHETFQLQYRRSLTNSDLQPSKRE